jgi:hypothetical protein
MSNRRVGKEGFRKHLLLVILVLAGAGLFPRTAAAGTITVAWDLMSDPDVTGYRVFIGTRSGSYLESFDVPADKNFFIFRSAFMSVRYYFAVAARFSDSSIGPRSVEVSSVGTRTVSGSPEAGARLFEPAAVSECALDCFVVTEIASNLGEITSLAAAGDGSLFAIEGGRRIVVLRGRAAVTAFEAEPGTTLRDLALDPQFENTGRLFVSVLRAHNRATGDLEVLRLRAVDGALGEPATILGGVSVPLTAAASLAAGDGLVYVALPALLARHPYSGALLAFDQDGRTPAGLRSPVLARGFDDPIDLAWDGQSRALWLLGRNGGADAQVMPVSAAGAGAALSAILPAGERASALAVAAGIRPLQVAGDLDLIEAAPGSGVSVRISLEPYGTPVAVAAAGGARYVATRTGDAAGAFHILKVEDGTRAAR